MTKHPILYHTSTIEVTHETKILRNPFRQLKDCPRDVYPGSCLTLGLIRIECEPGARTTQKIVTF